VPKISATTVAEHTSLTRERLLDAVEGLVLERPFSSITMREIAERASVSRTAIYNYAPDPITFLIQATERGSEAVRAAVSDIVAQTSLAPSTRLAQVIHTLLDDFPRATSMMLTVLDMEHHGPDDRLAEVLVFFRTRIGRSIMTLVQEGAAIGEFAPVTHPPLALAFMVGVMRSAVHKLLETNDGDPLPIAEEATAFLLNALRPHG
jgi:AcrR family transcriptional regulator